MRADRLLRLLLLLQAQPGLTAAAMARELGVSVRTVYRDVATLSAAGIPIHGDAGPGGGYGLLDQYRTSLTGLHEDELRALFSLSLPQPLADLNLNHPLKAGLNKMLASLPNHQSHLAREVGKRLHLDARDWFKSGDQPNHLDTIQRAMWANQFLEIHYRRRDKTPRRARIAPYGLVAKAGVWYLVAARSDVLPVYRVARIEQASIVDETFVVPNDFHLKSFWEQWCRQFENSLARVPVKLALQPHLVPLLPMFFGEGYRLEPGTPESTDDQGRRIMTLMLESLEIAMSQVLMMGPDAEVLAPLELRRRIQRRGSEIAARYREQG